MNLLQMSFAGGILVVVIVVLRAISIHRLPKKTFLILWGLVLCRLLIPYSVSSGVSVYRLVQRSPAVMERLQGLGMAEFLPVEGENAADRFGQMGKITAGGQIAAMAQVGQTTAVGQTAQPGETGSSGQTAQLEQATAAGRVAQPGETALSGQITQSGEVVALDQTVQPGQAATLDDTVQSSRTGESDETAQLSRGAESDEMEQLIQNAVADQMEQRVSSGWLFSFPTAWKIVWLSGAFACFLYFAVSYVQSCRKFRESLPVEADMLKEWYRTHPLWRKLSIRQSDQIAAPLTYGFFHPVILMPKISDWENENQIRYILEHEYVHIQRCDAVLKLAIVLAVCIHWFNPFVWVMYILFNRDIELSCDETVLRRFGEETKASYAGLLIAMEEKKSGLIPLGSSFSKTAIEERITAIMKIKKSSMAMIVAAAVMVASVTAVFATSAATDMQNQEAKEQNRTVQARKGQEIEKQEQEVQKQALEVQEQERKAQEQAERQLQEAQMMVDAEEEEQRLQELAFRQREDEWKEVLEPYLPLGVMCEYDFATDEFRMYYQGKEVKSITDEKLGIWITEHSGNGSYAEDAVELFAVYEDGVLTGLREANEQEEAFLSGERNRNSALLEELDREMELSEERDREAAFSEGLDRGAALSEERDRDAALSEEHDRASEEWEVRPPYGTVADYASLLSLKTMGYEDMTLQDFNARLLDWANEDYDRMERVNMDRSWEDWGVELSEEEKTFVALTVRASGLENAELVQSSYTGQPMEDPVIEEDLLEKSETVNGGAAWCELFYRFSYHVPDDSQITVGERDRCVGGMIDAIQTYWEATDLDELLQMEENDILDVLMSLAEEYSSERISVSIIAQDIHFEKMDERNLR